jgi:spore coat protein U-like protein
MKRNRVLLLGLVLAVLGGTTPVLDAAQVTTTFPVTASILAACTVSGSGLSFGTYSGSQLLGNGSIGVNCAPGISYNVALNAGAHFNVNTRQMNNGVGFDLPYKLFKDVGLVNEWGDQCGANTISFAFCQGGAGSGANQIITVYGQIPAGGTSVSGNYTDTVVVTVLF